MLAAFLLLASASDPDIAELLRFPPMRLVTDRLGVLIEQRYMIRGQIALGDRDDRWQRLLIANDHGGRGEEQDGRGEEQDGRDDEDFCRTALGRLRALLGERDWFAGALP